MFQLFQLCFHGSVLVFFTFLVPFRAQKAQKAQRAQQAQKAQKAQKAQHCYVFAVQFGLGPKQVDAHILPGKRSLGTHVCMLVEIETSLLMLLAQACKVEVALTPQT